MRTMVGTCRKQATLWVPLMGCWWQFGCSSQPSDADGDSSSSSTGLCGDRSVLPVVEIVGSVRSTVDQGPLSDVQIALVETNWAPGTVHGTARSDAAGQFSMTAGDIVVIEDCWGLGVSYWLQGESPGWTGDKPMNPELMEAYETGAIQVFLEFPLLMYPTE